MARAIRVLVSAVCAGILWMAAPSAAMAIDACDQMVVDDTSSQVLGDQTEVLAAADQLVSVGADVRIRAFDAVPGGTFDAYVQRQIAACDSWSSLNGDDLKPNLIVFGVSLDDQQSGIYAGSTWADQLTDPTVNWLRTEVMDVRFWEADFSGGIADAQAEAYRVLSGEAAPLAPPPVRQQPSLDAPVSSGSQGSDMFLRILLWGAGICVAIWILRWPASLVFDAINERRDRRQKHRQAFARATTARTDATAAINRLLKLDGAEAYVSIELVALQLDGETEQSLMAEVAAVRQQVAVAYATNAEFTGDSVQSDINPAATTDELTRVADEYDRIAALAVGTYGAYEQVAARAAQFEVAIVQAPQTLDQVTKRFTATLQFSRELQERGFRLDVMAQLDMAAASLETARQSVLAGQPGHALSVLESVEVTRREIHDHLDSLQARQRELDERLQQHDNDLTVADMAARRARDQLAMLQATYHAGCSDDLVGNLSEAVAHIEAARHDLATARDFISMKSQRWDEGAAAIDRAEAHLRVCQAPCEAVASRAAELSRLAAVSAGSVVVQLLASIDSAEVSVAAMRGNQRQNLSALAELYGALERVRSLAESDKPNYLAIQAEAENLTARRREIVDSAQAIVDGILAEERRRREAAEAEERRRRQQAAAAERERQEAQAAAARRRAAASTSHYGGGGRSSSSTPRSSGSSGSWGGGRSGSTGSSGGWGGKRR